MNSQTTTVTNAERLEECRKIKAEGGKVKFFNERGQRWFHADSYNASRTIRTRIIFTETADGNYSRFEVAPRATAFNDRVKQNAANNTRKDLEKRAMNDFMLSFHDVFGVVPTVGDIKSMSDKDLADLLTLQAEIVRLSMKGQDILTRAARGGK